MNAEFLGVMKGSLRAVCRNPIILSVFFQGSALDEFGAAVFGWFLDDQIDAACCGTFEEILPGTNKAFVSFQSAISQKDCTALAILQKFLF